MTYLQRLLESKIPVNWLTVWIGWNGTGLPNRVVSISEIADFATSAIVNGDAETINLGVLSALGAGDEDRCTQILNALAKSVKSDKNYEIRKWRFVLFQELLESINPDPLYRNLALLEFWSSFGFPDDGPINAGISAHSQDLQNEGIFLDSKGWMSEELRRLKT